MVVEPAHPKKLVQLKITSYLNGFRGIPSAVSDMSGNKKRKMSNRGSKRTRATITSAESTSRCQSRNSTLSNLSHRKRKLAVEIFSEDEESKSDNDQDTGSTTRLNNENSTVGTCVEKPVTLISVNRPSSRVSSLHNSPSSLSSFTEEESDFFNKVPSTPCKSVISKPVNVDPCCSLTLKGPICRSSSLVFTENNNVDSTTKSPENLKASKRINVLSHSVIYSPKKISKGNVTPLKQENVEKEKKKNNFMYVEVMKKFFDNILNNDHLECLLSNTYKELLKRFFDIDRKYQYTCMKLYMWKPSWYNIFKYIKRIELKSSDEEVDTMYNCLKDNGFVDTDYSREDSFTLLNLLNLKELRDIYRSFNFPNSCTTRDAIITKLLKNCKTQSTLTCVKSTEELLRDRIKHLLGLCVKLSNQLNKAFFNVYLLNTFTNPDIMKPQDYFKDMNLVFSTCKLEKYHIFYTEEEFLKYSSAIELRQDLEDAIEKKNVSHTFVICNRSYEMLKQLINEEGNSFDESRPKHLERFTAQAQYVSILSIGSKHIISKHYDEVKVWLKYLISQKYCNHKRGQWYNQLSLIYTNYLKNYKAAATLLISAFQKENEHFSEVQLHELAHRGKMLNKKTYKLPALLHDNIVALSPPSCDRNRPEVVIESKTVRNNDPGQKRRYIQEGLDGSVHYLTVEQTALERYRTSGFPEGEHCEGSLIRAAFCLLFFDIIYEISVKGTFVSEMQSVPLDMYTKYFYLNRKHSIKIRINDIATEWREEELRKFFMDKWDKHSHETALCCLDKIADNPEYLFRLITCIGRTVLSKIFERLVENFRVYRSGFPDLIVWNFEERKAKFVEVKGENDKLSTKQMLWLNYLMEIGADVEVCHVHSRGSKKKNIKGKTK